MTSETFADSISFSLPRWPDGEIVALRDFAGEVVVLDFFAYWCAPCMRTSPVLERDVQQYYQARGGNPNGLPVTVISINIESANPNQTQRFIDRTGVSLVLNDFDAQVSGQFGVVGIPFIAVLDGPRQDSGEPRFDIVYQNAGFEGVSKLREIINSLGGNSGTPPVTDGLPSDLTTPLVGVGSDTPTVRQIYFDSEALLNKDYQLLQFGLQYDQERGRARWNLGVTYNLFALDLDSPDPFFDATSITEDRIATQANLDLEVREAFRWRNTVGYYDGFSDYRSAWLNEYYRQIGGIPGFGGYPSIDPHGYQVRTGFRWEYMPLVGFLEGSIGYAKDWIVPSAEFERETILGPRVLDTFIYRLATENVLGPRVRTLLEAQLIDTSARSFRYAVQGSINAALTEQLVMRTQMGFVTENPEFESYFVGTTLEYEWTPEWLISLSGRYYHDTGEIQNSLPANNAPPGLESYQVGIGLRRLWRSSALKLFAGPYFTRYNSINDEAPFFEDLYQNRDWGLVQVAYSMEF